jgi:hypothetical protein
MKLFKRMQEFYRGLEDWDERPRGQGYMLIPGTAPEYTMPPTIIQVGIAKHGIIYAPPKNWFDWRPKYPLMSRQRFKRYIKTINRPRMLYKLCPECGRNCVICSVCLACTHQLMVEVEQKPELKKELISIMGSYMEKM